MHYWYLISVLVVYVVVVDAQRWQQVGERDAAHNMGEGYDLSMLLREPGKGKVLQSSSNKEQVVPVRMVERIVVHESPQGQMVLAAVLGACVGLLGGSIITVLLGCWCYFMRSNRRRKANSTYRHADEIDAV